MRYRVFLDTNVLISGIFFEGNESRILNLSEVDLVTCEDCVDELQRIVRKKLKHLGDRSLELALLELEKALGDIEILQRQEYKIILKDAEKLVTHKKDVPILAAAISAGPDYLLTGDKHFFTGKVRKVLNVKTTGEFLSEITKGSG